MSRHEVFIADQATPIDASRAPSRIAILAAEYDRWYALYLHVEELEGNHRPPVPAERQQEYEIGTKQSVRRMHEVIDEMTLVPAKDLYEFALKARIIREFQSAEWYGEDSAKQLDKGELLARSLVVELMAAAGLDPLPIPDFEPKDVFPNYDDPSDWSPNKFTRLASI